MPSHRDDKKLEKLLNHVRNIIDESISYHLRSEILDVSSITRRMLTYSVESGGKRLRPIMSFLISRIIGVSEKDAVYIACAIELSHAFTLVHDDMIDRPEKRRGKPPIFRSFGDELSLLAGDMLMTLSYKYLSLCDSDGVRDAISFFCEHMKLVIEGQILDVLWKYKNRKGKKYGAGDLNLIDIQAKKTSSLFRISAVLPSFFSPYRKWVRRYLESYGYHFGLAFQILDDISDVEEDLKVGAPNILAEFGEGRTQKLFLLHREKAISSLGKFFSSLDRLGLKSSVQLIHYRKLLKYLTEGVLDYEEAVQSISSGQKYKREAEKKRARKENSSEEREGKRN